MAIEISNEMVNNIGWVLLIVAGVYILASIGEWWRATDGGSRKFNDSSMNSPIGYALTMISFDLRTLAKFVFAGIAGGVLFTLSMGNVFASVWPLAEFFPAVWGVFTAMLLSATNVVGITDLNLALVAFVVFVIALAAGTVRLWRS